MVRKRVAVLFGGRSSEHDVSLETAEAFVSRVDRRAFDVVCVGIERETGAWYVFRGDAGLMGGDRWLAEGNCVRAVLSPDRVTRGLVLLDGRRPGEVVRVDAALPLLHGKNGEDGTVQGAFELAGIPVIGCGAECSALCMDKRLTHVVAAAAGVGAARSVVLERRLHEGRCLPLAVRDLDYPVFVKPVRAGSSIGITLVEGPARRGGLLAPCDGRRLGARGPRRGGGAARAVPLGGRGSPRTWRARLRAPCRKLRDASPSLDAS